MRRKLRLDQCDQIDYEITLGGVGVAAGSEAPQRGGLIKSRKRSYTTNALPKQKRPARELIKQGNTKDLSLTKVVRAQVDPLPFAVGDSVTLHYEHQLGSDSIDCSVVAIRGAYVRCAAFSRAAGSEPFSKDGA